jgi:hypothetical protein
MPKSRFIPIIILTALMILSSSTLLPQFSSASAPSATPPWITTGAYLNYSATGDFSINEKISNGSTMSFGGTLSGSVKITVNGVSNTQASVTYTPNIVFKESDTFFNGTTTTNSGAFTPINGTSTETEHLSQFSFGNEFNELESLANTTYGFSPNFNVTLTKNPGALFQLNSTTKLVALQVNSSVTESFALPEGGLSGEAAPSVSLNGTFGSYTSIADQLPLQLSLSYQGASTINGASLGLLESSGLSASVSGKADFEASLTSTNVNLPTGGNQATIDVPNYSTSLYVLSNSTISGAGTSGNQLVVNVTGPSGTHGVLDVFVSNSMLAKIGISNATQVGVTVDGQSYSNYTLTELDGGYLFTIYYHHSSHTVAMSFGNANFGTNKGSVSSIGGSSSAVGLSSVELYAIVGVIVVAVIAAIALTMMRRKNPAPAQPLATDPQAPAAPATDQGTPSPPPQPGS